MSEKFDKQYLRMAQIWSENSYAKRLKVGAIIVKDQMIISDGFNGTPRGFANVSYFDNFHTSYFLLVKPFYLSSSIKSFFPYKPSVSHGPCYILEFPILCTGEP